MCVCIYIYYFIIYILIQIPSLRAHRVFLQISWILVWHLIKMKSRLRQQILFQQCDSIQNILIFLVFMSIFLCLYRLCYIPQVITFLTWLFCSYHWYVIRKLSIYINVSFFMCFLNVNGTSYVERLFKYVNI